jgi:hypothetical protein
MDMFGHRKSEIASNEQCEVVRGRRAEGFTLLT